MSRLRVACRGSFAAQSPIIRWIVLLLMVSLVAEVRSDPPRVLLEVGRDYPETRLFSACVLRLGSESAPRLAVAGFSQTGAGDVSDLAVYDVTNDKVTLLSRVMNRIRGNSSIRTLTTADLDGDGRDELIALGRAGEDEQSSNGELHVYSIQNDGLHRRASAQWSSGSYTQGYGLDAADLDGDGQPEIVTGGFFMGERFEQAEIRVWRFQGAKLTVIASQSWGSATGDTRINSIALGDITGNGRREIVTGGRSGQVHGPNETTLAEGDQITVWSLLDHQLQRVAVLDHDPRERSRFRELHLANIDGQLGLEIIAGGRMVGLRHGTGKGFGTGGGQGSKQEARPNSARNEEAILPTLQAFSLRGDQLILLGKADWEETLGEVRDIAIVGEKAIVGESEVNRIEIVTILAQDFKPQRRAQLNTWQWNGAAFQPVRSLSAEHGPETHARHIVVWPGSPAHLLLTVGFVQREDRRLGQILRWDP